MFSPAFVFKELLAINDATAIESAAHTRRRLETIRTPLALRELTEKFIERNQTLLATKNKTKVSPSYIYLHVIPVRKTSTSGKRHYVNAQLQALRPQADFHEYHPDTRYCRQQIS